MGKAKERMIKVWGLLYDTHMEDVPMVAVSDRCIRRWRKQIREGDKAGLIVRVAQEMGTTLVVAEYVIGKFASVSNKEKRYASVGVEGADR